MTTRKGILRDILRPVNHSLIILLGVFTMIWGFWVGNPWWDVFSRAPLYSVMDFAPEWAWGLAALITGIVVVYGVIRPSFNALTRGAITGFMYWLMVSVMFFAGDWQNTGGITAATLAVYCGFIWLNLRVNRDDFAFITKE